MEVAAVCQQLSGHLHATARQRAYQPLLLSARLPTQAWAERPTFEAEIWVSSSLVETLDEANVSVRLIGMSNRLYASQEIVAAVPGNSSAHLLNFAANVHNVEDVFFLDLQLTHPSTGIVLENRYLLTRADTLRPALALPPTTLDVQACKPGDGADWCSGIQDDQWIVKVTNTGNHAALFLWLEDGRDLHAPGYAYFDANYFCLLPGEQRFVTVDWYGVEERRLVLTAWNADEMVTG